MEGRDKGVSGTYFLVPDHFCIVMEPFKHG